MMLFGKMNNSLLKKKNRLMLLRKTRSPLYHQKLTIWTTFKIYEKIAQSNYKKNIFCLIIIKKIKLYIHI